MELQRHERLRDIDWTVTREEAEAIRDISRRAIVEHPNTFRMLTLTMDLTACHCNGCPLRLIELSDAKDGDFIHDVGGISRHINRDTGELGDCFVPRYALRD